MLRLNKSYLMLAVFVLLIAFLVRLMVYDYSLPYVENIDEPNLYTLANNWRGFGEDGWRKNFLEGYPPGYIVLSGVVMNNLDVLFNPDFDVDMALYIRWLRYVSVLANMLTIAIVIRIGWLLSSPVAGILSGLLLSLSIPFIVNGITALPDTYMVLFGAGAVLACLFAIRATSWRWALIATILALLSISFKYNNFPILLLPAYIDFLN